MNEIYRPEVSSRLKIGRWTFEYIFQMTLHTQNQNYHK